MNTRFRLRSAAQRGFTLIELIVVTSAVALMSGLLLERVLTYQEMAERVAMQQTVHALRVSLQLQVANLIVKNRLEEVAQLAEQNPMKWLAQAPENYLGEINVSVRKNSVVSGHWYFDSLSKKLIYLVHNGRHFRTETSDAKQVEFQARLLRSDSEKGRDGKGAIEGVVLEQVNVFEWRASW